MEKQNKLVYMALPYTYDPAESIEIANKMAAKLMNDGLNIFSPISHSHFIADYLHPSLRLSQQFWMKQDLEILRRCDELWVVKIGDNGDELIANSKGCQSELREAKRLELPIKEIKYERESVEV